MNEETINPTEQSISDEGTGSDNTSVNRPDSGSGMAAEATPEAQPNPEPTEQPVVEPTPEVPTEPALA